MIILERSELSFSKCHTKNYITPPSEKMAFTLKRGTSIIPLPPTPPPIYIPITTLRMFLSFQLPLLKKLTMRNCVLVKLVQYIVIILRIDQE